MTSAARHGVAVFGGCRATGLAGVFAAALAVPNVAEGHSWYTGKSHPKTQVSCCGGYDCAPISHSMVQVTDDGWTYLPTGEVIYFNETLPSEDGGFHRCEFLHGPNKGGTRCLFVPGFGS